MNENSKPSDPLGAAINGRLQVLLARDYASPNGDGGNADERAALNVVLEEYALVVRDPSRRETPELQKAQRLAMAFTDREAERKRQRGSG